MHAITRVPLGLTPARKLVERSIGTVVGGGSEGFEAAAVTLKHLPGLVDQGYRALWAQPQFGLPVKSALSVLVPLAAATAAGGIVVGYTLAGLLRGVGDGSPEARRNDVETLDKMILPTLSAALVEQQSRASAPTPRSPVAEMCALAGALVGGPTAALLNGLEALKSLPEVGQRTAETWSKTDHLASDRRAWLAVGGTLGVLAYPIMVGAGSLVAGTVRGFERGGPGQALTGALEDSRGFSAQVTDKALGALDQLASLGKPADNTARLDPNTRIAIIGAGPAGLGAARRLVEKGYKNVTVLEKNAEAGGKVNSRLYDGRPQEMGAVVAPTQFREIRKIAEEVGVHGRPIEHPVMMSLQTGGQLDLDQTLTASEQVALPFQLAHYAWKSLTDWKGLREPGYQSTPPELMRPMEEVYDAEGMGALKKLFQAHGTGLGYGFIDEVPAAFYNKYFNVDNLTPGGQWTGWEEGYQEVFRRVAAEPGKTVEYNTAITRVERGPVIKIETPGGTREFDQLIVACPLGSAQSFLEMTPEEKALLGEVKTCDYRVVMAHAENLPKKVAYIQENLDSSKRGHPSAFYCRYPDSDLFTFYVLADPSQSDQGIEKNLRADVQKLGGNITNVRDIVHWDYFPHVDSASMAGGFYDRLAGLESDNVTLVGEIQSFSTVNHSLSHSQKVVDGKF